MAHGKLVRDRIPEIIQASGADFQVRIAGPDELPGLLRDKLVEETREVIGAADDRSVVEELADVLEVIHAYASCLGIGPRELDRVREGKRTRCGGFAAGVVLIDAGTAG
jgi:predicted house-cleaning noncanonical NTP pyrophosphatase (MazG superfamily)